VSIYVYLDVYIIKINTPVCLYIRGCNIKKKEKMKPLILQYTEKGNNENYDFSKIEYDNQLNLTVDKNTRQPAIDYLNMSTVTGTRTYSEESDSDKENTNIMMGTLTKTSYQMEGTDDDAGFNSIKAMMETTTLTMVSQESSDSD